MTLDERMKKIQDSLDFAGYTYLSTAMQTLREEYFKEKTQLKKRWGWFYEERNHLVEVINAFIGIAAEGDKRIAKLEAKLKDITLDGDMFSKGWDQALAKNRELEAVLEYCDETQTTLRSLFGDYEVHPTVEECVKIWNSLMEERHQLKEKLVTQNTLLDMINGLTKHIEMKLENVERNADLLIKENAILKEENQLLQSIREAQANMISKLYAEKRKK